MIDVKELFALAQQLRGRGRPQMAIEQLQHWQRSAGSCAAEHSSQLAELYGLCYMDMGEMAAAAAYYRRAAFTPKGQTIYWQREIFSNYLFLLNFLPGLKAADYAEQHFLYGRLFAGIRPFIHTRHDRKKLRIAYFAPDFSKSVVACFCVPFLAYHDRTRYEVFLYQRRKAETGTTKNLQIMADHWQSLVDLTPQAAAERIHADGIDILFDLGGHSCGGTTLAVMAYRPAPVQLSGIGYMGTTGLPVMDYFLTDVWCDPEGQHEEQFSEILLRMPGSQFCYLPPQPLQHCVPRQSSHKGVVFGGFNSFQKITDTMLKLWLQIIRQVPGSRLLLKNTGQIPYQARAIFQRARNIGFTADEMDIRNGSEAYYEQYSDLDIMLDTYPYEGGTTTCEALYMGVPVITRQGSRHGSSFGRSLLVNVGLGELAAIDEAGYVARAVGLGKDTELLKNLQYGLRGIMEHSRLMDGQNYLRDVEMAYETIWQAWLEKAPHE